MCSTYRICGKQHKNGWVGGKYRRNRQGRFTADLRLYKFLFIGIGIVGLSVLIWQGALWFDGRVRSTFNRVLVIENVQAQEVAGPVDWREEVRAIWKEYKMDIEVMERIVVCESNWKPSAVNKNKNGTVDRGIYQINSIHGYNIYDVFDPIEATYLAIQIWHKQGYRAWVCYR